jgi:hypothetical protein
MIKQLRVEIPNRPGSVEALVRALADAEVDMKALEVSSRGSGDTGVCYLIVDKLDAACAALQAADQDYATEEVVVVEMADEVGGLARILRVLAEAEVNVQHLYAFVTRMEGKSLAVLTVEDPRAAAKLLNDHEIPVIREQAKLATSGPNEDERSLGEHLGLDYIW